ncbi:MAG: hypothetical protein JKY37_23405 [Nannocystaceae bacterium]|nr:hypothetical protein [Nannocystaceae bacterium]
MTKDTPEPGDGSLDGSLTDDDDAVDLEEILGGDDQEDEEAALDLSDLDELGVQGVVDQLRGGNADPVRDAEDLSAAGLGATRRKPRSPVVSAIVLVVGGYLLLTMFADFRYWITSSTPVDLGDAADLVSSGQLTSGAVENKYVVLRGTPDVQHAARLTTKARYVGYLRIIEGGGGLFAAVPRSKKEEKSGNAFQGQYIGRMTRLGSDRAFPWLEQFFGNEGLSQPVDYPLDAWVSALQAAGPGNPLELEGVKVARQDEVRVVTDTLDVRLQLGRSSFNAASAREAVASLGYPWVAQEPTTTFYRFLARIPEGERNDAEQILAEQGQGELSNPADPAIGVLLLPLRAAYLAEAGMLRLSDGVLSFPYGGNTTSPGYDAVGGKLVERSIGEGGGIKVPLDRISAVRYEQPITVDPNGYIIEVGADPAGERTAGILWLVVLGLSAVNLVSLLLWVRRRSAAA